MRTYVMAAKGRAVISSKQGHVCIHGAELDIVCSYFGDRVFLLVSELQKLGTLLDVSCDQVVSGSAPSYSVRTLLGKDEPEVHVFGRAIAGHLSLPPNTPLLLALGLRDHTPLLIPPLLRELEHYTIWEKHS